MRGESVTKEKCKLMAQTPNLKSLFQCLATMYLIMDQAPIERELITENP